MLLSSNSSCRDLNLKISLYDRDLFQYTDDLIGTTIIDIEDRLRSNHRAFGGIFNEYSRTGYNVWRNVDPPSRILNDICTKHGLDMPVYFGNKIQVGGITFEDTTVLEIGIYVNIF